MGRRFGSTGIDSHQRRGDIYKRRPDVLQEVLTRVRLAVAAPLFVRASVLTCRFSCKTVSFPRSASTKYQFLYFAFINENESPEAKPGNPKKIEIWWESIPVDPNLRPTPVPNRQARIRSRKNRISKVVRLLVLGGKRPKNQAKSIPEIANMGYLIAWRPEIKNDPGNMKQVSKIVVWKSRINIRIFSVLFSEGPPRCGVFVSASEAGRPDDRAPWRRWDGSSPDWRNHANGREVCSRFLSIPTTPSPPDRREQ